MNRNPRPRKYASDAERQAAFRARYPTITVRLKAETLATLERISESLDKPRSDLVAEMIAFALANRNWHDAPTFTRSIVSMPQARRRATKYRGNDEGDDDAQ